ncbi:MAG: deoxyguanosinetriphosphate triphosphohydrolase [Dehalococcoidales bacterium]|nr:deoxyguanosinetriphosphate triphosphohydrolase [Dehalococcoidales bacterium]
MGEARHVRELIEEKEEGLSPFACRSVQTRGRERYEDPPSVRTEFQRDRDRILHCKSFRRLKHKTQVFIAPAGDHYRTRLTHTLEVSQIARTIARALNLNEDLTEAISLGHDLGHTPFGHIGEDVLNELAPGGFHHNEQSLRIVELLENDGKGLNLTWEVRNGIVSHSKSRAPVLGEDWGAVGTLEGEVVKLADIIAYLNHDSDDAIRAGIITENDLPEKAVKVLGTTPSRRIDTMVTDVIFTSWPVSGRVKAKAGEPFGISMSEPVRRATGAMRDFMFTNVYEVQSALAAAARAKIIVNNLFQYYLQNTGELPPEYRIHGDNKIRWVIDYVAGMTDQFAENIARKLSLLDR